MRLLDGRQFDGELVGSTSDFDLAILHLKNADNLPQAAMGDSSDMMIGETVIAIGNPSRIREYRDHGSGFRPGAHH